MHKGFPVSRKGKLAAIDCEQCGYAHLDPLPSQEELDAHWDGLYSDGYLYEQEQGQWWYWNLVYRERLKRFDETIPPMCLSRPGNWQLLDYGAGIGNFVFATRRRLDWWSVFGYEPNEIAQIMSPIKGAYIPKPQRDSFEGVHCSLVLEHVLNPLAALRHIRELLVPGGIACIVVPSEFNPLQRRLYKWGYNPLHPHHVNYFMQESLEKLVEAAGFEVVETTATFPIEFFALTGLNYVKQPHLGIIAHWLRMLFEAVLLTIAPGVKRRLYRWFARQGIGREIELWVRKKAQVIRLSHL